MNTEKTKLCSLDVHVTFNINYQQDANLHDRKSITWE